MIFPLPAFTAPILLLLVCLVPLFLCYSEPISCFSDVIILSGWLLLDAWPNSSSVADEVVAAARAVRGEVVAPDAGWNVEDFAVALDARIPHVKGAGPLTRLVSRN